MINAPVKVYRLERTQLLALDIDRAWQFFSDPNHLPEITPPWLSFLILDRDLPNAMFPGMLIRYRLKPLFGLTMDWVTEITHVREPYYFVDEQRFGPYRMWHHQHHFRAVPGGIEMMDRVDYVLPMGPLGRLAHAWMIRKKLASIFAFRHDVLQDRFGQPRA